MIGTVSGGRAGGAVPLYLVGPDTGVFPGLATLGVSPGIQGTIAFKAGASVLTLRTTSGAPLPDLALVLPQGPRSLLTGPAPSGGSLCAQSLVLEGSYAPVTGLGTNFTTRIATKDCARSAVNTEGTAAGRSRRR